MSFLNELQTIVGTEYVLTAAADTASYFHEYGSRVQGKGLAVVKPANTEEVSQVVKLCAQHKVPLVAQGGNTGLVGGSVPYRDDAIVLS